MAEHRRRERLRSFRSEVWIWMLCLICLPMSLLSSSLLVLTEDLFQRGLKKKPMAFIKKLRKVVCFFLSFYNEMYLFC
ncbi:hypothetical protein Hanom_Chr03g00277201 [Helianthus anomalus]